MRGERGSLQSHPFEKPEYDPIADNVFDTLSVVVDPVEWNARIEALRNVALEVLDIAKRKDVASCWTPARTSTRPAKTAIGVTGIRERMPSSTRSSMNVWKCFVGKPLVLDRKSGK